ncbi:MAG: hypothetical protein ACRDO4_05225 [Nocardioides sp.]
MGVLFDYFAAASDDEAAAVVDRVGGPGSQAVLAPQPDPPKRGLFGRRQPTPAPELTTDPQLAILDTVADTGIEPTVQLGTLEELLTGRAYDDIAVDPGQVVASRDAGRCMVVSVSDELVTALAASSDGRLAEVVVPWSQTEEFWGDADPADLHAVLRDLAALARRAQNEGLRLYCWVSV